MSATPSPRISLNPKPEADWTPPRELAPDGESPSQSLASGRGRNILHGFPLQMAYVSMDVFLVWFGGALIFWLRFGVTHPFGAQRQLFETLAGHTYLSFFLLYAALVVVCCRSQHLYSTPRDRGTLEETLMVTKAVSVATALLTLTIFASGNKEISRLVVVWSGVLNIGTLAGWRYFKRRMILSRATRGIGLSRVLIVGSGNMGQALASWLEDHRQLGYTVCGFLDPHPNGDRRVLGSTQDLGRVARMHFVDELFITLPSERDLVKEVFLEARRLRLNLHVVPDLYDGLGWCAPVRPIGGFSVMELHWQPIPALGLTLKRATDILIATFGLTLTAPFLALSALWIRLESPGPIFFVAPRVGWKGRKFQCYKLRTMVADAPSQKDALRGANGRNGPFFKMEKDPRVTRCGRWLRKFSVDELPQLWNVLIGDMSLVGPRPHPVDDFERYELEHLRRLDVKPGLTGLWQVTARRDPSFETSMRLDLEYIENWNLWLDLKIMARTLPRVLQGDGQ